MSDLLKRIDEFDDKNKLLVTYDMFIYETKKGPFIGPQPLQILPRDIPTLTNNTVLTPKIDGVRYLCIIKKNSIGFVNRGMEFYVPKILYNFYSKNSIEILVVKTNTEDPEEIKLLKDYKITKIDDQYAIDNVKKDIKDYNKRDEEKLKKLKFVSLQKIFSLQTNKKLKKKTEESIISKNDLQLKKLEESKDSLEEKYNAIRDKLKEAIKNKNSKEILQLTSQMNKFNYSKLKDKIKKDTQEKLEKIKDKFQENSKYDSEIRKIEDQLEKIKNIKEEQMKKLKSKLDLLEKLKGKNDKLKKSKKLQDKFSRFIIKNDKIIKMVKKNVKLIKKNIKGKTVLSKHIDTGSNQEILLDCEIVDRNGHLQVFIFDCIMIKKGKNIDKVYKLPFFSRMNSLYNLFQTIIDPLNKSMKTKKIGIKFYRKKYYDFNIFRENLNYEKILKINNDDMNLKGDEKIEYDGIIFVNTLFRYYLAPGAARGQYKWKPKNQLTIDLKIVRRYGEWKALGKYDKQVKINNRDISDMLITNNFKDDYNNKVYEFVYNNGRLNLYEPITERTVKGANAFLTILGTIEAGEKHFTIQQFQSFLLYMKEGNLKKTDISWLDKETFIKIIALCKGKNFFNEEQTKNINKQFLLFFGNNPGKLIISSEKEKIFEDLQDSQTSSIRDIAYFIKNNYIDDRVSINDLVIFLSSNKSIIFLNNYQDLISAINKEFDLDLNIFTINQKVEEYIKRGNVESEPDDFFKIFKKKLPDDAFTYPKDDMEKALKMSLDDDIIQKYKKQKKKMKTLSGMISVYNKKLENEEYEIIKLYKPKFVNYNKFIRVSLIKNNEETSSYVMDDKASSFYKLLSYLKGIVNNPFYNGTKTIFKKVKAGEKEFNFFMNRENVTNASKIYNVKDITSDEIFYSQKLNYEKNLDYNINIELGQKFFYNKYQTKHIDLPKQGPLYFQTVFTFYLPGIPWSINLIKTVKEEHINLTREEKKERRMLIEQIMIMRNQQEENKGFVITKHDKKINKEHDIYMKSGRKIVKETSWEIEAVMPIRKFIDIKIEKVSLYQEEWEKLRNFLEMDTRVGDDLDVHKILTQEILESLPKHEKVKYDETLNKKAEKLYKQVVKYKLNEFTMEFTDKINLVVNQLLKFVHF
jgi:hypothetical protein